MAQKTAWPMSLVAPIYWISVIVILIAVSDFTRYIRQANHPTFDLISAGFMVLAWVGGMLYAIRDGWNLPAKDHFFGAAINGFFLALLLVACWASLEANHRIHPVLIIFALIISAWIGVLIRRGQDLRRMGE